MPRYFIEVAYKGTAFAGFQIQPGRPTIQSEVEQAFAVILRKPVSLTGSSRTDTGVHAHQNFFHVDLDIVIQPKIAYNLNAILPNTIVVKSIQEVAANAHCRFDATHRKYCYNLHFAPDPFLVETSWLYPYPLDVQLLQHAADIVKANQDFTSFCKLHSQAKTMICAIEISQWNQTNKGFTYHIQGNRFLRGMVRGLVGTMLQVGRGKIDVERFKQIVAAKDCGLADFSTPAHGLFLQEVGL